MQQTNNNKNKQTKPKLESDPNEEKTPHLKDKINTANYYLEQILE